MLKLKLVTLAFIAIVPMLSEGSYTFALQVSSRAESSRSAGGSVQVELQPSSICDTNILRFGDIAKLSGSPERVEELSQIPLAPSPTKGMTQTWKQKDVEQVLALRGIDIQSLRWTGSALCYVERSSKSNRSTHLRVKIEESPSSSKGPSSKGPTEEQSLTKQISQVSQTINPTSAATPEQSPKSSPVKSPPVKSASYTAAFVSPGTISQAEHVVATLIESYLQTQTDSEAAFYVEPKVAPEHAKLLIQRRQISGVSGGTSPYEGAQEFSVAVKDGDQEVIIPISAEVRLPELFLAAKSQLPKGHILRAEDLTYVVLPRSSKESGDAYAMRMDDLIGKELKRSMSTRQMIRRAEVSVPKLVHVGDLIKIEVIVGGVVIETNGKALESGGADELIHVETLDHRKKLIARIRSERVVEVYSQGNSSASTPRTRNSAPSNSAR